MSDPGEPEGGRARRGDDEPPGAFLHLPVMVDEVTSLVGGGPAGTVVDATLGGGGHSAAILDARGDVRVLGLDRDADAVAAATARLARFGDRVEIRHTPFSGLAAVLDELDEQPVAVLFDLGVSSPQLDRSDRGFAHRHDGPLDMRMDVRQPLTAATVVNTYPERDLASVLRRFGDERHAGRIARAIVAARPITTTSELAAIVIDATPAAARRGRHPARRTFQALRIEVNAELDELRTGLGAALDAVAPGGRVIVLTYHSGEDRIVKDLMREVTTAPAAPRGLPVEPEPAPFRSLARGSQPTDAELADNPRASSVRLRAVERRIGGRS
ncbi:MAG: 16S rRNA (cytosine(1402)-N(4))-methyltransferase RsmH [Actinomycetota bacterium]|nr:16S rRNA (cytosine(1402)-N(4))-methyltransferase RsmH [Actinomycetota bacterium]